MMKKQQGKRQQKRRNLCVAIICAAALFVNATGAAAETIDSSLQIEEAGPLEGTGEAGEDVRPETHRETGESNQPEGTGETGEDVQPEALAPYVEITPDNEEPARTHTYTVTVTEQPEEGYAGIREIQYTLTAPDGKVVPAVCDADGVPQSGKDYSGIIVVAEENMEGPGAEEKSSDVQGAEEKSSEGPGTEEKSSEGPGAEDTPGAGAEDGETSLEDAHEEEQEPGVKTFRFEKEIGGLDGVYTLSVTAVDRAGNEAEPAVLQMRFDNKAPAISLSMGAKAVDGNYYYRADNCAAEITIGDESDAAGLDPEKTVITIRNPANPEKEIRQSPSSGQSPSSRKPAFHTIIRAEEIAALADGLIEIRVTAEDAAGNKSTLQSKEDIQTKGILYDRKAGAATFILDTAAPVLLRAVTDTDAAFDAKTKSRNEHPYEDGAFYYNKAVQTTFFVADENLYRIKAGCSEKGGKTLSFSNESKVSGKPAAYKASVSIPLTEEGRYTAFYIEGTDKAGNRLCVDRKAYEKQSGKGNVNALADENEDGKSRGNTLADENESGQEKIVLKYDKIIDRTAPQATIVHQADAPAYLYGKSAYISSTVRTTITISDKAQKLDEDKLYCGPVLFAGKQQTAVPGKKSTVSEKQTDASGKQKMGPSGNGQADRIAGTWLARADGHYKYAVFGTDRAGNPVTVKESFEKTKLVTMQGNAGQVVTKEGCKTSYQPQFDLVVDRTNPTYDLNLTDVKSKKRNVSGTTAYYNKTITGSFRIRETNFDPARISAGAVRETPPDSGQSIAGTAAKATGDGTVISGSDWQKLQNTGSYDKKRNRYVVRVTADGKTHETDGVWRFAIQGCDRAGNPLVKSTEETKKSGYRKTIAVSEKNGQFMTPKKVMDTKAPAFSLRIGTGKRQYYSLRKDADGNQDRTGSGKRFRKEKHALFSIQGTDASAVNIRYRVDSTVSAQNRSRIDALQFKKNPLLTEHMKGEQIFRPGYIVVTDRAGNQSFLRYGDRIFLDAESPKKDITGPSAQVRAVTPVTKRNADGRNLYNGDVTLQVQVADPYPGKSSAGLRRVTYQVFADGVDVTAEAVVTEIHAERKNSASVSTAKAEAGPGSGDEAMSLPEVEVKPGSGGEILLFQEARDLPFRAGADPVLCSVCAFRITLPSGKGREGTFETNDIEVRIMAEDNAGNRSAPKQGGIMRLGIDTIRPQITVAYDNNDVKNDRYFRAPRTATVTVTDRNIDSNGIRIRTEASVPDVWAYTAGRRGNGNGDIRKKELRFAQDGMYTMQVSGEDALGNRAVVHYSGAAPKAFAIDQTAPIMTLGFDGPGPENGKYYKDDRTAFLVITEKNFRETEVQIRQEAFTAQGKKKAAPAADAFHSDGDRRQTTIRFAEDGTYALTADYTDLAGNPAQTVKAEPFVIDKTKPMLKIAGVSDQMACAGMAAPQISFEDVNYSAERVSVTLKDAAGNSRTDLIPALQTDGAGHGSCRFADIPVRRENDGVYTLRTAITDLAGNHAEAQVSFSVNRFGSSYDLNDDSVTEALLNGFFTAREQPIVVREINVDPLKNHEVICNRNGENRILEEGTDYRVTESRYGTARAYVYEIKADNFREEGTYSILLRSEDAAGNQNVNSAIRQEDRKGKGLPLEFAVDKTSPEIHLPGAGEGKAARYYASEITLWAKAVDNMNLSRVRILLNGQAAGDWRGDELQELLREEPDGIPCMVQASGTQQELQVFAWDAAGNRTVSEDCHLLVTKNLFAHYFDRRALWGITLAAVIALIALRIGRKKHAG